MCRFSPSLHNRVFQPKPVRRYGLQSKQVSENSSMDCRFDGSHVVAVEVARRAPNDLVYMASEIFVKDYERILPLGSVLQWKLNKDMAAWLDNIVYYSFVPYNVEGVERCWYMKEISHLIVMSGLLDIDVAYGIEAYLSIQRCEDMDLKEASRLYFGEQNIERMLKVLGPFHEMLDNGAMTSNTTIKESFHSDYNSRSTTGGDTWQSHSQTRPHKTHMAKINSYTETKSPANALETVETESLLKPIISAEEVPVCVHGTYKKFLDSIVEQGLKRMERLHVHFSCGLPTDGMRCNINVLIFLDVRKAMEEGMKFYISDNKVILTEGFDGVVPVKYFEKIESWLQRRPIPF